MDKIIVNQYSEEWPELFRIERERVQEIIPDLEIEHIGSTAVPGLKAKLVIDMMGAVPSLEGALALIEPLAQLGYVYAPELEAQTPDRRFFQRRMPEKPWYHLSLAERTSEYWIDHILFRDYLRTHPEEVAAYEKLKEDLVQKHVDDFDAYNAGKSGFIMEIVGKAKGKS